MGPRTQTVIHVWRIALLGVAMIALLGVLVARLWSLQVARSGDFQRRLERQSLRSVRLPGSRGDILDRNGVAMAENRPSYCLSLYPEEIRKGSQKFLLFYKLTFTDRVRASVQVDLTELAGKLALKKPRYIIIAHNHPSGDPTPSSDDDATVKKLILLCSTNGCALGDSIIFGKNTAYSYMVERRFENDPEFKVLRDAISLLEGVK